MDDQVLIHILETACSEESLIFQVVEQDRHLHVFLNREPGQVLDYKGVGKKIYQALIRLSLTDIDGVCLYSRVLGEEEPDWEAKFRLPQAKPAGEQNNAAQPAQPVQSETQRQMSEAATYIMQDVAAQRAEAKKSMVEGGGSPAVATRSANAVAAPAAEAANYPLSDKDGVTEAAAAYEAAEAAAPTVSVVADMPPAQSEPAAAPPLDEGFDLASYCFIRNRMLLTADILPPSKAVATQVNGFHEFSMAEKQRMMPQLELFFKGAPTFSAEGLTEAQQTWFQEMEALTGDDARKGPIWLSRYCVDAEATLAVVARVFDPSLGAAKPEEDEELVEASANEAEPQGGAAHSISGAMTGEMSAPPRSPQARPGANRARQHPQGQSMGQASRSEPAAKPVNQWLWPSIVVISSIFLMCLGMILAKPAALAGSEACNSSTAPEQCQLATQIVGPEFFEDLGSNIKPLPALKSERDLMLTRAARTCSTFGAENAGHRADVQSPKKTLLQSNAQEILPGITLADVMYRNAGDAGPVRTACVVTHEAWGDQPEDVELWVSGAAVIPANWPTEAYDNSAEQEVDLRVEQAFHPLFTFGSTMLFTTVGLFAAALLRMAVAANNMTALYQASIAMSIFEGIFELLLPLNGLFFFPFMVARKSLALGLTSAVVPGFKVDWSGGYMSVAGCVAVMMAVRFVLRWLMILTFLGGAFA